MVKINNKSYSKKQMKNNQHMGSTLQSLFEETGEWEEVKALAEKKINDHLETIRRRNRKGSPSRRSKRS